MSGAEKDALAAGVFASRGGGESPSLPARSGVQSANAAAGAQRWRCVCAYDGTGFSGWQSQARGLAIQDVIEARLAAIFGRAVRITGSGRTDAGVHALGQVFHFDAAWPHGEAKLLLALRNGLPPTIQIKSARPARASFHARFQATGKCYEYRLHLGDADPFARPYCWMLFRPLDVAAMRAAAARLLGRHDFRAFTALNGPPREDTVRTLRRLDVIRRGAQLRIVCEGDGFLYKMVRSLVGALVSVGEGKLSANDVAELLASRRRSAAVQTAPAQGLFLMKVFYGRPRKSYHYNAEILLAQGDYQKANEEVGQRNWVDASALGRELASHESSAAR